MKRLERKYEGFVCYAWIWHLFCARLRLNVKNTKLLGICFDVWDKSINFATENL